MTPMLAVRGLSAAIAGSPVLASVALTIAPGSFAGLIGRNGAGKTSLMRAVMGLLPPSAGEIGFQGRDLRLLPPQARAGLGIGYMPEDRRLVPELTVEENVLVALAAAEGARPPAVAALRSPERVARADEILARLGLEGAAERATTELPQGQRKLLDIGLAMVDRSAALLLDEPTSGISAEEKFPLMDLVMQAVAAQGSAIMFVEHDMELVERYSGRVIAFYEGRIIADGAPAAVLADADVRRYVVGSELHRRVGGRVS